MRVPTQRTKFRNNTELGQGVAEGRDTKQESKALAWSWVSKEERAVFYSAANLEIMAGIRSPTHTLLFT
jgi:hypothetical protein